MRVSRQRLTTCGSLLSDSPVFSMAVTSGSSSTILAVGCADGGIHLRSARTGEAVSSLLNAHRGEVQSLSWLGCAKGRDEALVMEIAEPKKGDSEKMEGCEEGHDVGNRGRGAEEVVGWLASAGPDRRICVWSSGGELMRVVELPKPGAGGMGTSVPALSALSHLPPQGLVTLPFALHRPQQGLRKAPGAVCGLRRAGPQHMPARTTLHCFSPAVSQAQFCSGPCRLAPRANVLSL